jgi:von Willebrand factor type A domain/Aerotolerance regulator N-terminal
MSNMWSRLSGLSFPFEFSTPLGLASWFVLAGVPVGIIALYFLKLRRRPVRVPSTILWRKSLEDLHVNSLFQRLRRNLLLFLQLLAVVLAMLALAGPRMKGTVGQGQRFVLMIDNSASMAATDVGPSRLALAKEAAKKVVKDMDADDLAMVIAFAESAQVVSNYTGDRRTLTQRIDAIQPTQDSTSLREGLQVAAGLANPSKQIGEGVAASSVVTPTLYLYTDGGFADVEGFSLGNLKPQVVVIGPSPPPFSPPPDGKSPPTDLKAKTRNPSDNLAILALQARRDEDKPEVYQLFGRVHNYRDEEVETEAQLYRRAADKPGDEGSLVDAIALKLAAQSDQSFKFDLPESGLTPYEVRLTIKDALEVDNHAYVVVGTTRKAQVLAITAGNRYLTDTLKTPYAVEHADITIVTPEEAKAEGIARDMKGGHYDLIIYDGVKSDFNPQANALYFGEFPPGPAYAKAKEVQQPVILDWDIGHPMMQYVRDLSLVYVAKANVVELPVGAKSLIDSNQGPVAFMATRDGYTDAVVTFPLMDGAAPNTTWFRYISFPLFILNSIQTLGNVREGTGDELSEPGRPIALHAETANRTIKVTSADGRTTMEVPRSPQGTYVYNYADKTGIYQASWEPKGQLPFAVNLFDSRESDLAPRGLVPQGAPASMSESFEIKIGYNPVVGTQKPAQVQKDIWWWLALGALGVLLFEWYIYNRRVYV